MSKKNKTTVYICKTDYDYHIPDDINGIKIYFSEKHLRADCPCVKQCGIVKATLEFEEVIHEGEGWRRDDKLDQD